MEAEDSLIVLIALFATGVFLGVAGLLGLVKVSGVLVSTIFGCNLCV